MRFYILGLETLDLDFGLGNSRVESNVRNHILSSSVTSWKAFAKLRMKDEGFYKRIYIALVFWLILICQIYQKYFYFLLKVRSLKQRCHCVTNSIKFCQNWYKVHLASPSRLIKIRFCPFILFLSLLDIIKNYLMTINQCNSNEHQNGCHGNINPL